MQRERRREQGVVMFITVLLLAMMGGLGLAALDTATRDRDTAGYYNKEAAAFYAADAGVEHARALVRDVTSPYEKPNFPDTGNKARLGDGAMYSHLGGTGAVPGYYGDPDFPDPVRSDGQSAGQYSEGMNLQSKGAKAVATLWQINVVGEGSDGETAKLEAKEVKFIFGGGY
jgi:hypothetical protein